MIKLRQLLFLFPLITCSFILITDLKDDISNAFKSGNASNVAAYFYSSVEIDFPENKGVYSKSQSEQILNSFFKKNAVTNFTTLHQGESKEGIYIMGNLITQTGNFRVYCYLKKSQNSFLIKELRIEK